jgi:hypothetical protein
MSDEQSDAPNAYDVVIASLEGERQRLTDMIHALRRIRSLGIPFEATSNFLTGQPAAVMPKTPIPHDAFFGMTIPDAARKYLSWGGNRQTKSNGDLCDALREGGFQTTAANFGESVRATLSRHPDFVKIKGQWGLREWYGDRAARRPRRASAEQAEQAAPAPGEGDQPEDEKE